MASEQLEMMRESGIVAVLRKVPADRLDALVDTFASGGIRSMEVTVDSDKSYESIHALKDKHGADLLIGAGTITNKQQAVDAIEAGADFIFAPILDRETIDIAKGNGKIVIPGVFTPTEMHLAHEWGADIVKIFPARSLGPSFIKDTNAPLGHIRKMPTGGIDLSNIGSYIKAGSFAAGIGSSLVDSKKIAAGEWEELERIAFSYVQAVQDARR